MGAFQISWKNIMRKRVNYNTVQRIVPDTMGLVTATSPPATGFISALVWDIIWIALGEHCHWETRCWPCDDSNTHLLNYPANIIMDSLNNLLRPNGEFCLIVSAIWRLKRWKNMGWHFSVISAGDGCDNTQQTLHCGGHLGQVFFFKCRTAQCVLIL